jgi:hypothetical protein
MTRIQQVHWELTMDYIGHPYYVSGNAILHALAHRLQGDVPESLQASHGIFVPGQFGTFPEDLSQTGARPGLGGVLPPVESCADLFCFRHPTHSWLLDSRARDALNVHGLRRQSGHPALAHGTIEGQPDDAYRDYRTTTWYVHAYLHADDPDVLPVDEDRLDGLQFGGKRNYGYGETRLKDTQVVDLDEIAFECIAGRDADAFAIELLTPYVLESTHPNVDDHSIPWWWDSPHGRLREREEKLLAGGEVYRLRTVDHGQLVGYAGDSPLETARNGIRRVGSHAKYGFGEFRLRPIDADTRPLDEDIALR